MVPTRPSPEGQVWSRSWDSLPQLHPTTLPAWEQSAVPSMSSVSQGVPCDRRELTLPPNFDLDLALTASETIFLSWGQGSAQVSHSTHAFQIWRHLWPWGEVVGNGEEEEVSFPLEMTPVILNYSSHSTCFCISFGGKKGQSPWMQLPCLIFPVSLQPLPRVCWVQVAWCWSG